VAVAVAVAVGLALDVAGRLIHAAGFTPPDGGADWIAPALAAGN
jgi:hypothetical protein